MVSALKDKRELKRLLVRVYGIVQGVGFRPFVSRAADRSGVTGSVCNKGSYVEIIAEGGQKASTSLWTSCATSRRNGPAS